MIVCPNCKHNEVAGALFCSECGALLVSGSGFVTQTIKPSQTSDQDSDSEHRAFDSAINSELEAPVSLFIVDAEKMIPLAGREEFTLGRSAEGQPILPDIDLANYQAYEFGVSRLHLSIKLSEQEVIVKDLGSVNGTYLNGQKIAPHKAYSINHGDMLLLGKLKIQTLIRR